MAAPRRNIELKASDPDPERSLAVVLGLGARDRGLLRQRDTYFRVTAGRLKLREEEPGGAVLIQYDRVDADEARESRYRLVPVDDPRDAVRRAGVQPRASWRWSRRSATCCCGRTSASTSTGSRTSATSSSSRGSRPPTPTSRRELDSVTRLTEALEIPPERILRNSYSDQVVGSDALVEAARAVMERAHAPYSRFRVGAALRAEDGSIHVGANVENAAYPQGQCAEASAIGALIAAGLQADHRGRGDLRRRGLLRALRRLPPAAARVHRARRRDPRLRAAAARARRRRWTRCCRAPSARSSCPSEASTGLQPRASGSCWARASAGSPTRSRDPTTLPVRRARGLPAPSVAGHGGHAAHGRAQRPAGRGLRRPQAHLRGRRPGRDAGADPRCSSSSAPTRCWSPTRRAALSPEVGPGRLMAITDHINLLGVNPLTGPNDDARRPALPEPARRLRPGAAASSCAPRRRALGHRPRRGRLSGHRRPDASRPRRRSGCSGPSAPTRSGCLPCPR